MTGKALALRPSLSPQDGLTRYLQEIAAIPMLGKEEERDLAMRWQERGDVAAAHRLVTSHLRLVAKIAFKYRGYGLPVGDLIAEGNIGLMQAVKKFDPKRGFRLATYAIWWIKASIQEYILRSWSLVKIGSSATQKRLFFNLKKIKKKIGAGMNDRGLTNAQASEIADILDVEAEDVMGMEQRLIGADASLNAPMAQDSDNEKIDFLASPDASQETLLAERQELQNRQALLSAALAKLNDRERDILSRRRLKDDPDTLDDLSQQYNISRERVRQIEMRAFEKLQQDITNSAA